MNAATFSLKPKGGARLAPPSRVAFAWLLVAVCIQPSASFRNWGSGSAFSGPSARRRGAPHLYLSIRTPGMSATTPNQASSASLSRCVPEMQNHGALLSTTSTTVGNDGRGKKRASVAKSSSADHSRGGDGGGERRGGDEGRGSGPLSRGEAILVLNVVMLMFFPLVVCVARPFFFLGGQNSGRTCRISGTSS